jgi:hypothetical protein
MVLSSILDSDSTNGKPKVATVLRRQEQDDSLSGGETGWL